MASKADLRSFLREEIRKAPIKSQNDEKDTTLEGLLSWNLFRIREEQAKDGRTLEAIPKAVTPSTITAAVAQGLGESETDIDPEQLAELIAQLLLANIITTQKEA